MDVESPKHLQRLRDQPEVKAALLRFGADSATDVRFERAPKNALYRSAIQGLLDRWDVGAPVLELQEACVVYGRPCWLLATSLSSSPQSPLAIAVVAADGASVEVLLALLRSVSHDYWLGSYLHPDGHAELIYGLDDSSGIEGAFIVSVHGREVRPLEYVE